MLFFSNDNVTKNIIYISENIFFMLQKGKNYKYNRLLGNLC